MSLDAFGINKRLKNIIINKFSNQEHKRNQYYQIGSIGAVSGLQTASNSKRYANNRSDKWPDVWNNI